MVRRDEQNVSVILASLDDAANRLIRSRNTLSSSLVDTGMTNHIRGSKVVHDEIELVLSESLAHLVADVGGAHLGVLVVCGDLGRGDQVALLARELLLDTAVEEEGDVGVLLRFGDVALLDVFLA